MRPRRTGIIDVQYFVSVRQQPIRNQHAVTPEINPLSAHVTRARLFPQPDQFMHGLFEVRSQHVIGIVAEALIPQSDVG